MQRRARPPVPRQQFVDPAGRVLGDPGQDIGQPNMRIDVIHLALTIRLYIVAARWPPRSEPANSV